MPNFLNALMDPQFRRDVVGNLNSALGRGLIAQTLGAPADIANLGGNALRAGVGYLGHKTGLLRTDQLPELVDNPVGGSEWIGQQMQQRGLINSNRNTVAEMLAGGMLAPSGGAAMAARAPQIASAMIKGGENLAMPRTMNPQQGAIDVYHGSPHSFDKFQMDRIGTGEGAQAYGHGLYFAENPKVSEAYINAGRSDMARYKSTDEAKQLFAQHYPSGRAQFGNLHGVDETSLATFVKSPTGLGDQVRAALPPELLQAYEKSARAGNLYETRLAWPDAAREAKDPLGPQHFLQWDRPLSEQSGAVRELLGPKVVQRDGGWYVDTGVKKSTWKFGSKAEAESEAFAALRSRDQTGASLYDTIKTGADAEASNVLRQAGIPGIRYMDQGSRGAGTGTANYVVFDDAIPTITGRR